MIRINDDRFPTCRGPYPVQANDLGDSHLGQRTAVNYSSAVLYESIQLHVTCALVLGVIPAAAVLLLAAVLVSLLSFLGTVYDFLRAALAHGLVSCISLLRAILVRSVNLHELHINRVLVQAAGQLVRSTMAAVIWTRHLLRRAAGGARNGWTFVVREVPRKP